MCGFFVFVFFTEKKNLNGKFIDEYIILHLVVCGWSLMCQTQHRII